MSRSLSDAIRAGNVAEVEIRLNMGEDVDQAEPPLYRSPLHWAVACNQLHIAELLVQRKALLDSGDRQGGTALALAKSEKKTEFIDLLTSAGARATVADCSAPVLDVRMDPLFRDPPPWALTLSHQALVECHHQPAQKNKAQSHQQSTFNPPKNTILNISKTKAKEEVPKSQTQQSTSVLKSQAPYLPVPEPVSGPKPWSVTHCDARPASVSPVPFSPSPIQSYPVTDSREEQRPQSQASLAESLMFQGEASENAPQNDAETKKHEDGGVKSYMTKFLKLGTDEPEGRGEKGHNRHSFKMNETKMQAYLSTMMRSKEKGMQGKERPISHVSIAESVKSKGSTARTYISNMLHSKTEVSETDKEIETTNEEDKLKDIEKSKTSKFKTYCRSKGSSAKSSISNIMHSTSKLENIPDSQEDKEGSAKSRLSKTIKLKKDSVANFVSNMSNKRTKETKNQKDSVASEHPESKGSSLKSFFKQHVKTPAKVCDMVTLLKEKSVSSKKYIKDKLKKSEDKESSNSETEDKSFQSPELTITEGHLPKMSKYTGSTSQAETLKNTTPENTVTMKHETQNSNSFMNSVDHTLDDSDTITSSSVREYVQRYEAKHMSNTTPNNLHSRPFNYFTGNVLSSSTYSSGTAVNSEGSKVTVNVAQDRVSFVTQKSADTAIRTGNEKSHPMKHKEEEEKRSWDIRGNFRQFSDKMARRKTAGVEKVEQSWTGVKTQVKRTKLVRALHRKKAVPEEDEEGKFFLQTGSGRKGQLYTFRKSPM